MDHILDANDAMTTQSFFYEVVRSDGCPLAVNLDKSSLVDHLANGFDVGCAPSNVGFCNENSIG